VAFLNAFCQMNKNMGDILDNLAQEVDKISEKDMSEEKEKILEEKDKVEEKEKIQTNSIMGQLFKKSSICFPELGNSIEGFVIDVSSNEIYLDLGIFGTGVVLGKEIKDGLGSEKLKIGDKVMATIIELENEEGYMELSIREASYEKSWDNIEEKIKNQEKVIVKIVSANKGGLLVDINGVSGFLPVSQLSSQNYPRVEDGDKNKILTLLKKLVSQELEVCIIDADRETEKLIVSEKAAQSDKDKEAISSLKAGDIVLGEISGVVDFGAFVKFVPNIEKNDKNEKRGEKRLEGLVHISELAWQLIEDPRTIVKVGDSVEAQIIGIDKEKISLSIRSLQKDPWVEVTKKYKTGDIVSGVVNKINHFGAFVYLDKDIHGLAHISEMAKNYPGKSINEMIKVEESYNWKILSIEAKTHRMGLVLTQEKISEDKLEEEAKEKKEVKSKSKEKEKKEVKSKEDKGEKPKKIKKEKKEKDGKNLVKKEKKEKK